MDALGLVVELDRTLPGFSSYFQSQENLFDGTAPCAVFAACTHFVRERPLGVESWRSLAALINNAVGGSDEAMAEAACACFLENLAASGHPLKAFLDGDALRYWNEWEAVG